MPTEQEEGAGIMKYFFVFFFLLYMGHGKAVAHKPSPIPPSVLAVAIVPSPVRLPVPTLEDEEEMKTAAPSAFFFRLREPFSVRRLAKGRLPVAVATWLGVQKRRTG